MRDAEVETKLEGHHRQWYSFSRSELPELPVPEPASCNPGPSRKRYCRSAVDLAGAYTRDAEVEEVEDAEAWNDELDFCEALTGGM